MNNSQAQWHMLIHSPCLEAETEFMNLQHEPEQHTDAFSEREMREMFNFLT